MRLTIFFIIIFPFIQNFEIFDYSNEPYVLIPMETTFLYKRYEPLFHVFNVSEIREKFNKYSDLQYKFGGHDDKKIMFLISKCEDYIKQLTAHRKKRGIDFLGSILKFITGTPDHDDMVLVQNKLNELIDNNNRLAVINTKLQQNFENLQRSNEYSVEVYFEWIAAALEELIHTINLAKSNILNTAILNLEDVNQIINKENRSDAPLMEILEHSIFKILEVNSVYVLLIKYPVVEEKCMLYSIRPVELESGKLQLEESAAFCTDNFITVRECKKYITTNLCKYFEHTCTQELINGNKTQCTIVKEHMKSIDEIGNGKILIHGTHTINGMTKRGTYAVFFNDSILIDNKNYTNDEKLILQYLKSNKQTHFEILNEIESQNEELKIQELTLIEKIPMQFEKHPILSFSITILNIIVIIVILHYMFKCWKAYSLYKIQRTNAQANARIQSMFELQPRSGRSF